MQQFGAIFDMDGVLVDSYQAHFASWGTLGARHGLEMSEEQFAATFGKTSREIIRQFWSETVADEDVDAWDSEKETFYRQELQTHFPEMPGASALLRRLEDADWALAVGSSGPPENVAVVVQCLPAGGLFGAAVNGHDVTHGKPAPDIFLRAAEKLALPPEQCCVVEDAPVGVQAAHAAGMAVAALTGTVTREQLAQADLVVDSLDELTPDVLAAMVQRRARA